MATALSFATRARAPWLLTSGALALAGFFGWQLYGPAASGDPIATSLAAFEKSNRLTVFSAQLVTLVDAHDERGFGLLKSKQVAVIPARVDYTLDLSQLDARRFSWDESARRLTVTLPPLQVSKPNLDEAKARYIASGVWITGDAQAKLTRDNTIVAEGEANKQAANPALIALARGAAKQAVAQNLGVPLKVAGYSNVSVDVRFDAE
ncbi:DUF4230 domain-containing protein [Novosphingobium sp.]|uniref:DUF4230 domain-containing protein n=1 Tax=Novosphingobium sp. TaxID=1874826 RepID=UPI00286BB03B|nr:DUF4230 domain-containing protein [Novosphingobium sp.]